MQTGPSGERILICEGEQFQSRCIFATFDAPVGALRWSGHALLACVSGQGLRAFSPSGKVVAELGEAGGAPVHCPTAITVARDGTIYIVDGSRHNAPEQWLQDLMECRPASGRLIAWRPGQAEARVLAEGLAWPAGVEVSHDEGSVLVTEAWIHRLSAFAREDGRARILARNFAGYPGRIARAEGGDHHWIAFFALRSQLTEFVLREPKFRRRMMAQVPPELWIGPTLGGRADVREPTQIGRIKKLGIQKPWAPARSYGLVACLDEAGHTIESLHSRAAGMLHGITDIAERGKRLLILSKGHGKLVAAPCIRGGQV